MINSEYSTLWAFGDSFTYGYMCRDEPKDNIYLSYKKENDDIWVNHLSKFLNYNPQNLGKNGASNDFIIDTILDNFEKIKENDIVIIGKTIYGRNNFPKNDEWVDVSSDLEIKEDSDWWESYLKRTFTMEERNTIMDYQYYFSNHKLYEKRQIKRFDFIKKRLLNEKKVKNCYVWYIKDKNVMNMERIIDATKYKIRDYHFSFKGHLDFANFLKRELEKEHNKSMI